MIQWRARMLVTAQTVGLLAMIGVTWRLWFPQLSHDPTSTDLVIPSIPVFGFLVGLSSVLSWVISAALICFGILGVVSLYREKIELSKAIFLLLLLTLICDVLLNQHRFLPWVWQSMILLLCFTLLSGKQFLKIARVLLSSIYIWSAISKLDYQFVKTTGREIFQTLTGLVGFDIKILNDHWVDYIVISFPVIELLIGIGLWVASTRWFAMCGGFGMHVILILALGPFGLGNAASVLIWNLLFAFQLYLLYWPVKIKDPDAELISSTSATKNQKFLYALMTVSICCFPILEKFNGMDHWPAWGLYSPQASRCRLYAPEWKVMTLPPEIQSCFKPATGEGRAEMREFNLSKWSIDQLNAPVYPQDRFQFALARHLVKKLKLERSFLIEVQSSSNWWTGKRTVRKITRIENIQKERDRYWFNTES